MLSRRLECNSKCAGKIHLLWPHRPTSQRVSEQMRSETIAIHSGYDVEPTTKAVAVPIYQTVAYEFDSARPRSTMRSST
jgi:hypothetical protein